MSNGKSWPSDFASGIKVLDQQHQRIFALLQKIDAAVHHLDGDQAEHLVIELLDFTVTHNHLEDQIMAEAGYPQAEAHQASHRMFLETVDGYMQQIVSGENPFMLARRVRLEVTRWLEAHMLYEDLHCVSYLRKLGHDAGEELLEGHSLTH